MGGSISLYGRTSLLIFTISLYPPNDGVCELAGLLWRHRLEAQGGAVAETLRHHVHNRAPHTRRATRLQQISDLNAGLF